MKIRRVMLAAPKSGSGKTMLTCALLQTLKDRGEQVISYKCGPDYIDPMFHKKVIDIPSKNLDTFFTNEEQTKRRFLSGRTESEIAVLEGVMGLYDGLGGVRKEGSSYHLAEVTDTPVILVVDAKGMGKSILALIAGFLSYDEKKLIKGVLLNRMSKSYYQILKPLIEQELKIRVVGYFPEYKIFQIESRHLGLKMPEELPHIKEELKLLSQAFAETVSLDEIMTIAEEAGGLSQPGIEEVKKGTENKDMPVIAVARDEAFCFYYEDNLQLLEEYGARLSYFSPLHDRTLPQECDGILLGGGYPELYAEELGENKTMLSQIREAISDGTPIVAECGGFMYLHEFIQDKENKKQSMTGVIPAGCHDTGKLVRFGYIEIKEKKASFLPEGQVIRGHEFHYFDSEKNGEDCIASKPVSGKTYPCILAGETYWMGFPHLYYPSNPAFARNFVEKAVKRKGVT